MDKGFDQLRKTLAANVVRLRKAKSLSQEKLALEAEVDRTYVSQIERRINNPSLLVLYKLAERLGTTVDQLVAKEKEA
jgi:transcriptional regulator with XRE-family HTH domain